MRKDESSRVGIEFRFSSSKGLPKAVLTSSELQPWGNRMVASAEHSAATLDSSAKVRSRARHIASWQIPVASWSSPFISAISAGTSAWQIASRHCTRAARMGRLSSGRVTADASVSHLHMSSWKAFILRMAISGLRLGSVGGGTPSATHELSSSTSSQSSRSPAKL